MQKSILKIIAFVLLLASLAAYIVGAGPLLFSWTVWVFLFICINLWVWKDLMRVATFAILVIWSFAFLGNLIPQSSSGSTVAMADIERTPDAFIAAGDAIFHGKGKCATCHTLGEGATEPRCPDLSNIGMLAASRKPELSAKDYLVESLYLPSDYLVQGYGKIMPEAWKPPIALTPLEIETVIAFLQSQGSEPDLAPVKPPVDITAFAETPQRELKGDIEEGKYLFEEQLECIKCHKVGEKGGEGGVGPELSEIGALNTVEYIEESIIEPNAQIVMGYGSTTITLDNGEELGGIVLREDDETITLKIEASGDDWDNDESEDTGTEEEERVVSKEDIAIETVWITEDVTGQGFFWIQAVVNDSTSVSGMLADEDATSLSIKTTGDKLINIVKSEATSLAGKMIYISSKMPRYDELVTIKQFEDLLTYLASLKGTE